MEFRRLRKDDDRTRFSCGDDDLDTFFRRYASQNQFRHQIGVTHVLADGSDIGAFVSVAAHSLQLPEGARASLPRYPLPVLLIARLAVSRVHQGQGLGRRLLRECCTIAEKMSEDLGCVGIATDAKAHAVTFYERFGFTPLADVNGHGTRLYFLPLRHALGAARRESE
jgi:GNAT superfamily N-acetyltransferase